MALVKSFRGSLPKISVNIANSQYVCTASLLSVRPRQNRPSNCVSRRSCSTCNPVSCKVAIVTGGARGIGKAIAEQLLENEARAVVITDILVDEAEKTLCEFGNKYGEDRIYFQPCDVICKEDMERVFKCTKSKFKQIDIVVNNAGILQDSVWERCLCINIHGLCRGTFLGFQAMGKCSGGKGGYIINVASILGLQPEHGSPVYTGTKHFVIGFTRSMGCDFYFKQTGVKVMAVCPGVTDTNMITESQDHGLEGFKDVGKALAANLNSMPSQPSCEVGKCIITMLKKDENGTAWVSEGSECWKVNFPARNSMRDKCDKKPPPPAAAAKKPPTPPKGGPKK